jgi:hypothetical protein
MPNAKVGDLCFVSGKATTPGLAGRIVEVIRLHTDSNEHFKVVKGNLNSVTYTLDDGKSWVCKSANLLPQKMTEVEGIVFLEKRVISDSILIPLRDNDEEDEMITIAGKSLEVEGSF